MLCNVFVYRNSAFAHFDNQIAEIRLQRRDFSFDNFAWQTKTVKL